MKLKYCGFLLLLVVAILVVIASCSHDDGPSGGESAPIKTLVLDAATVSVKLVSVSDDGTLTFSNLTADETPEVGNIICTAPSDKAPFGFFYTVKSIRKDGVNTVIETSAASIADAVGTGSVSISVDLSDYIRAWSDDSGNAIAVGADGFAVAFTKPVGNTSATLSGNFTNGKCVLNVEVGITNRVVESLKLTTVVSGSLTLNLGGDLNGTSTYNSLIASLDVKPVTVVIAGIPVVITPKIPFYLRTEVNGTLSGEIETARYAYAAEAGVTIQDGKLQEFHYNQSPAPRPYLTNINGLFVNGEVTTAVVPTASLFLYNSKTAALEIFTGLYGRVATDGLSLDNRYGSHPNFVASMGGSATITAKLQSFGMASDLSTSVGIFDRKPLEREIFPQFSTALISNVTTNSANARTIVETSSLSWMYPVSEHGLCWGNTKYPSIASDAHTQLGALTAVGDNAVSIEATLTNLVANETYYIYPYFTNYFGTFYGEAKPLTMGAITPCPAGSGVTINGVTWACADVGDPETFAEAGTIGSYYQWNRLEWNESIATPQQSDTWDVNPCPEGWRLPTTLDLPTLGGGRLQECMAKVNGQIVQGYGYQGAEGNLFFPRTGTMTEDGVVINPTETKFWLNEMLHIHEAAPTTFWLTYIADVSENPFPGHILVYINLNKAPGITVRCVSTD